MVKTEKTKFHSVREALEHFSLSEDKSSHVPNYAGFAEWISTKIDRMKIESSIPLHAIQNNSSSFSLHDDLVSEIKKSGILMTPEGPKLRPDLFGIPQKGGSKLRALNQAKLLFSFLSNISDRWRETLLALQQMMQGDLLSKNVRSSSPQAQQRFVFFSAISKNDINLAFKMLGRLREEDHDPGELEYLEAVANFYSNEFDKAIEYASSVQAGSADWLQAIFIKIESLALQGKTGEFLEVFSSKKDLQIPINYMRYLLQLLIKNASDPLGSLESIGKSLVSRTVSEASDLRAYGLFNRYSCNLAVQWVEYRRDLILRQCAAEQSNAPETTEEDGEDLPLAVIQIQAALLIDQNLFNEIESAEIDVAYQAIVRKLLNWPQSEPQDFIQALQVQWRIGDREVFLNNVIQNLDRIDGTAYRDFQQILGWAYQEALAQEKLADAKKIEKRLQMTPSTSSEIREFVLGSTLDRIERQLSPMGKFALRAAEKDLRYAELPENVWHDAGMISLGYFRILELEINARFIVPMVEHVDISFIENELFKISAITTKNGKKIYEFWKRLFPQIKSAKTKKKGLGLGALELLFRKLQDVAGDDVIIKKHIFSSLALRFSDCGLEALSSGELADLINENARETYRNPPAHTRYVDLRTAQASKSYVQQALGKLLAFTASSENISTKLH